jgi:undecaprenyl pyrophosphate phosphatase UppP
MAGPTEIDRRFWVLLLVICAVAAVVGSLLGQLLGLAGVEVAVALLVAGGLVLLWRYRSH